MTERSEVLNALENVLKHPSFASSKQLSSFLSYIVKQKLDGNESALKAYTIAIDALERPDNFDPQTDPIVRVLAGRLRHGLDLYYREDGAKDAYRIAVPKGSYRPEFHHQEKKLPEIVEAFSVKNSVGSRWLISSVVILTIMAIAVFFRVQDIKKIADEVSRAPLVAVAEFASVPGDPDMEKFIYGLRFDLISELSRFSWLSTFAQRAGTDDRHKSGRGSKRRIADYILYGSVNTSDKRFRMSFRLESADSGIVRWAQVFDREFTAKNIFEIQKEAVTAIAVKIGSPDGVIQQAEQERYQLRTSGLSAYACTLRTHYYWKTFLPKDHLESRDCLEHAVVTDPLYPDAHAALAYMYLDEYLYHFNVRGGYDPVKRALKTAKHAVKLDPYSTLAKQALFAATLYDGNVEEFIRIGREAIDLAPNNPTLLADFGSKLSLNAGFWDEGIQYSRQALELNSEPAAWYYLSSAFKAINDKDYEKALYWSDQMNAPDWIIYNLLRAVVQSKLKDLPKTQEALKTSKNMGIKDYVAAAARIKGFHFHPKFEAHLIKDLRAAFDFAKGTS